MNRTGLTAAVSVMASCAFPTIATGQPIQTATASGRCASAINVSNSLGPITINNNCPVYAQLPAGLRVTVDQLVWEKITRRRADHARDRQIAALAANDLEQSEQIAELKESMAQVVVRLDALASSDGASDAKRRASEALAQGNVDAAADLLGQEAARKSRDAELSRKAAVQLYLDQSELLEIRDLSAARVAARKALAIDPRNLDAIYRCAVIATNLGRTEEALRYWSDFVSVANRGDRPSPPSEADLHRLADVQVRIADLQSAKGETAAALDAYEQGLDAARQLVAQFPENTDWKTHVAGALNRIGSLLSMTGDISMAAATYAEMLRLAEQYDRDQPETASLINLLAMANGGIAEILERQMKTEEALTRYQAQLGYGRRLVALEPEDKAWRRNLALILMNRGGLNQIAGNSAEAQRDFEEGASIIDGLIHDKPGNVDLLDIQATFHFTIGRLKEELQEYSSAQASFVNAATIERGLALNDPTNLDYQEVLTASLKHLAQVRAAMGHRSESQAALREAEGIAKQLVAGDRSNSDRRRALFQIELALGDGFAQNEFKDAERAYRSAITLAEGAIPKFPQIRTWLWDAALAHGRIGLMKGGVGETKRRRELQLAITRLERLKLTGPFEDLEAAQQLFTNELVQLKPR